MKGNGSAVRGEISETETVRFEIEELVFFRQITVARPKVAAGQPKWKLASNEPTYIIKIFQLFHSELRFPSLMLDLRAQLTNSLSKTFFILVYIKKKKKMRSLFRFVSEWNNGSAKWNNVTKRRY